MRIAEAALIEQEVQPKLEEEGFTLEAYFELEEKATYKSEFQNGKIVAMPGGTTTHASIIYSLSFYIRMAAKRLPVLSATCNSEMSVYIAAINEAVYPDASIVLGELALHKKNKAITNPAIIFEVLSDTTGNYDRGDKFRKYQRLSSFREYVLIEQDQPIVDVFHKKENGNWEMTSFVGLEAKMQLKTLDIQIPLKDIYEDVIDALHFPQYKMDL